VFVFVNLAMFLNEVVMIEEMSQIATLEIYTLNLRNIEGCYKEMSLLNSQEVSIFVNLAMFLKEVVIVTKIVFPIV
jgi:hypothetical protein